MLKSRTPLRFHWSLPTLDGHRLRAARPHSQADPVADFPAQLEFCRQAEDAGIDSLLLPINFLRSDPLTLAGILSMTTNRLTFMVAARSGIISPTYFVQQVNTVALASGGRISINVVMGRSSEEMRYYGDFLDHDERCRRTDEFWTVCDALWRREFPVDFDGEFLKVEGARINDHFVSATRERPEVYFSGTSDLANQVGIRHGDCLLSMAEPPHELAARIRPALEQGREAGIVCTLIAGPTHAEAIQAARELASDAGEQGKAVQHEFRRQTADSVGFTRAYGRAEHDSSWLTPYLWNGLVPYMGPPWAALVGDPDEIVEALFDFREAGLTQFVFHGAPDLETMIFFGKEILPRIRQREQAETQIAASITGQGPGAR